MNITTDFPTFEAKSLAPLDTREALIDEVWSGLRQRPRSPKGSGTREVAASLFPKLRSFKERNSVRPPE